MITKIRTLGFAYPLLCILACNNHVSNPETAAIQTETAPLPQSQPQFLSAHDSSANPKFKTVIKVGSDCKSRAQLYDSLSNRMASLDVDEQLFFCNTNADTALTCAQGTVLRIKKNSLVDAQSGKVVHGDIIVKVKEYYNVEDAIAANLTTTCGSEILESGGMLFIEILSGHSRCKLLQNETIGIDFSGQSAKNQMQLFEGNISNGRMDWKPLDNSVNASPNLNTQTQGYIARSDISVRPVSMSFDGSYIITYPSEALEQNLKGEVVLLWGFHQNKTNKSLGIISSSNAIFNKAAYWMVDKMIRENKISTGKESIIADNLFHVHFEPGKERKSTNQWLAARRFDQMISSVVPKFTDAVESLVNVDMLLMPKAKPSELIANSAFKTSRLGWINCDRFIFEKGPCISLDIPILASQDSKVYLIFKQRKSILQGTLSRGRASFGKIPKNEEVLLVVIKNDGENIAVGKKKFIASDYKNVRLEYKSVNLEGLKDQLVI